MNKVLEIIKTPQDSVNDDSVIITDIFFKNGDKVMSNDVIAEIETSKALIEITCEESGYINCLCEVNQEVLIGEVLFEIHSKKIDQAKTLKKNENIESPANVKERSKKIITKFSKGAEKLINKHKLNKNVFADKEFVTIHELNKYLNPDSYKSQNNSNQKINPLLPNTDLIKNEIKIDKQKLNEIKYLTNVNSSGTVSRLTIFINANLNLIAESQNFIESTPLPLITYDVSRLLIKYPKFNSFFYNDKLMNHKDINIGIAFDNGINGLKVASIYNSDLKDLNSIEEEITDLSIKYNKNKLSLKEITSASFTITDLFSTGVCNFHPLINNENSAILGVCGLHNNGFNIEFSFDHRVSNGLEASKFLNDLKYRLEARYKKNKLIINNDNTSCSKCFRKLNEDFNKSIEFLSSRNEEGNGYICSVCLSGW